MSIDFGANSTAANPVANNVRATEGVVEKSPLLSGLNTLFDQAGEIMSGQRESRNAQFLSDFTNRQLLVTDALEQGRIRTSAQARTMMRRNFLDAIESNPGLREDLLDAHKGAIGFFGSTELINEGTVAEQRRENRISQLVTAGLLDENHTEADFEAADSSAQIAVAAQERYDSRIETLNLELTTGRVSDARRSTLEAQRTEESRSYLRDVAPTEAQTMTNQFNAIVNGPGTEAEKVQAIQDHFIQWRSQATARVTELEGGEFTAFLAPFEQLQDLYVQRATGELTDQEMSRAAERITTIGTLTALQDPDIANLAVGSNLFSDSVFQQALVGNSRAFNAAIRFLSGTDSSQATPSPFVTDSGEQVGMETYLDGVLRGLESDNPATVEESSERVGMLLDSIEDYEGMIRRDPKAGIALVRWMSSPAFIDARNANPEQFANIDAASEVIKNHYDSEVWGMVRNEFTQGNVSIRSGGSLREGGGITTEAETTGMVEAIPDSSGMKFIAVPQDTQEGTVAAQREARRLNNELAPVINTTLKASAHLSGRTDYGTLWGEVSEEFLGAGNGDEQLGGGDAGDDLTLTSFTEAKSSGNVEQFVDQIIQVESGGRANAANPRSSAEGLGQFIDSTWMNMINQHRPDLAEGRSREEILQMKFDPDVSREMTTRYAEENSDRLVSNGLEDTPGNIYLAHFLGGAGAVKALKANPSASVAQVMGQGVVDANPFLRDYSIAQLIRWAERKMTT